MRKWSAWLIIIGIIIILIPIGGKIYVYYEQQKLYNQYLDSMGADIMDAGFNDGVGLAEPEKPEQEPPGVMGKIKIPAIAADLLLLEGSSGEQLRYGAGHVAATVMPGGQGNCAVAGHRDYAFGTYFSRLDELEKGDLVTIEYQGDTFTYEIFESFVVEPAEVSVLSQTGQSILTLITCTPKGSGTHRLIVRGKLIG